MAALLSRPGLLRKRLPPHSACICPSAFLSLSLKRRRNVMPQGSSRQGQASLALGALAALTPAQQHWDVLRQERAKKKTAEGQPRMRPSDPVERVKPRGTSKTPPGGPSQLHRRRQEKPRQELSSMKKQKPLGS